jgi:hypothetical protein
MLIMNKLELRIYSALYIFVSTAIFAWCIYKIQDFAIFGFSSLTLLVAGVLFQKRRLLIAVLIHFLTSLTLLILANNRSTTIEMLLYLTFLIHQAVGAIELLIHSGTLKSK